jgi:hypothetical protein
LQPGGLDEFVERELEPSSQVKDFPVANEVAAALAGLHLLPPQQFLGCKDGRIAVDREVMDTAQKEKILILVEAVTWKGRVISGPCHFRRADVRDL